MKVTRLREALAGKDCFLLSTNKRIRLPLARVRYDCSSCPPSPLKQQSLRPTCQQSRLQYRLEDRSSGRPSIGEAAWDSHEVSEAGEQGDHHQSSRKA